MQRRDLVVECITAFVEAAQRLGDRVLQKFVVDSRRARAHGGSAELLEHVQEAPRIAVGVADQELFGGIGKREVDERFALRTLEQPRELRVGKRLQHVDRRAREQRAVHFERRILGRRADERDQPLLDEREECVLLRLVEAMNFIDEQDRVPAGLLERELRAVSSPRGYL